MKLEIVIKPYMEYARIPIFGDPKNVLAPDLAAALFGIDKKYVSDAILKLVNNGNYCFVPQHNKEFDFAHVDECHIYPRQALREVIEERVQKAIDQKKPEFRKFAVKLGIVAEVDEALMDLEQSNYPIIKSLEKAIQERLRSLHRNVPSHGYYQLQQLLALDKVDPKAIALDAIEQESKSICRSANSRLVDNTILYAFGSINELKLKKRMEHLSHCIMVERGYSDE